MAHSRSEFLEAASRARAQRLARERRPVIFEVITEERERELYESMYKRATEDKSISAASWLWDRMYGKPAETLNLREEPADADAAPEATESERRERSAAILVKLAEAGLLKQTIEDGIASGTVVEGA